MPGSVKMNSEVEKEVFDVEDSDDDERDDLEDVDDLSDDDDESNDNVGDVSVEINVEELVASIEKENDQDAARRKAIRLRLEELAEERSLEDTFAIEFGDEDD